MKEKRRIEEEKKAKEEDELRRNQDFARKAEEFKLQLRVELMEEWRRSNAKAEKAVNEEKKIRKTTQKAWSTRRNRKGKKTKRRGGESSGDTDTDSSSSTESVTSDTTLSRDSEMKITKGRPRGRNSKKRRARDKGKNNTGKNGTTNGTTLVRTHERGECSRPRLTETIKVMNAQEARGDDETEPRTPLTGGYKGLSAGCSQKGLIEYCISAHKIYSAKKADSLRKICEKKGLKYTKKPEVVEMLARHQVELAYDGFEEVQEKTPTDAKAKTKASGSPRREFTKDRIVSEKQTPKQNSLHLPKEVVHVLTRFSKLDVPRFVKNSKNVTRSARACSDRTIGEAVREATKHLAQGAAISVSPDKVFTRGPVQATAWTDDEVRIWNARFQGLVLAPIDRNQGDTAVMCPILYRRGFGKTFAWNNNYETVGDLKSEPGLLKEQKADFIKTGLQKVGGWKADGRLGTAYVIPKHKDLTRWRPIAPAPADLAGLAQRRIAKALHCLLKRLPAHCTFYLNSIAELAERLQATSQRLRTAGCDQAMGRCYDIKEMFSRIPHGAVVQAMQQLLRRYEDDDCKQVRVSFRGKLCVISNNKKQMEGYVGISLKTIMDGVNYDLRHTVVKCGTTLVRQVFGIPMGKATSPILASITCAMVELRFIREIGADRRLVGGWRIMDDITIIAGTNDNTRNGEYLDNLFQAFKGIYDRHLEVIRKDECGLTWDFVGGTMMICGEPLQLHYTPSTKNTGALYENGTLVFQTMQDYDSYSPKSVKKAVLTAMIKRLWDHATSKQLVLGAIGYAVCEADLRGYPPEVSLGALADLAKAVPNQALQRLYEAIAYSARTRRTPSYR
ncbi:hypothetical protein CBR_g41763 [Chara braunii]|uniref:Reverse transcriptase domain-containing protein n=1 Tax=Chara braunii TaxID=69332 RepID=A0A388LWJ3_CHABU|nr:hypothetical protein CBR_g41763 [Chara braunii]|eukprot:GBG86700.1 hypothetical protein CBR_g41763 [Chara braunii]